MKENMEMNVKRVDSFDYIIIYKPKITCFEIFISVYWLIDYCDYIIKIMWFFDKEIMRFN